MGITIHFKGRLKNLQKVESVIDEFKDISEIMKWKWNSLNEDWNKPATARLSYSNNKAEITGHLSLKGIQINLHPDCEPLPIFFDSKGYLRTPINMVLIHEGKLKPVNSYNSVKTQFAPPDIHISIIKLLQFLKKQYVPGLEVIDEGDYWNTGDRNRLIEKIAFLEEKMDILEQALSSVDLKNVDHYTPEEIAKLLEDILRKKM